MEERIKEIAERIRLLRELANLSQEQMAKNVGVTLEDYRRLENGETDFSFTVVYKCAQCFGVDVTDILQGTSPTLSTYSLVRGGKGLPIARKSDYIYQNMAPYFKNRMSEPFWVKIPYTGEVADDEIHMNFHKGEEVSIVISGSAKAKFGDNVEIIHPGDVIYFNSATPHGMAAIGGEPCVFFTVIVDPEGNSYQFQEPQKQIEKETAEEVAFTKETKEVVYERFILPVEGKRGQLKKISFQNEERFNFAFDVVDVLAKKSPNKLAMLHVSESMEERRFTFLDMAQQSSMAAHYLKSLGIRKGDRVMLVLKRNYQFWVSILALHKLGAIVIPATNQLVKKDFVYRFEAAGVRAIICTADGVVAEQVELAEPESKTLELKIIANGIREGWHSFDEEVLKFPNTFERPVGEEEACGEDIMLMFFTSGTTGYPKIAAHTYQYALGHFVTAKYWHKVNSDGIHFTISDTGWGKALWGKLYGQWLCEAAVFTYDFERFNAHEILPMFEKYKITTFCAPPTMYRFFIKEDLSKYDLSSLEYATVAGEALNPEVYNQFYQATGVKLMEGFGQTETTLTIANLVGMELKLGSMGKASPLYEVDLVNPEGNRVTVGEIGEIVVKMDKKKPCGLFAGYYQNEAKTKEVCYDGMYHTGDTAWRDEDGYFWYVGRTDDLIKSSGYRIGPFEIESVIMELPYVLECAVTAVPDEIRGQAVKASVVLTKGTIGTNDLKKEIQEYVKTHTAPYKYPRVVEFLEDLPKTISGKIRRVDLRE